ncbi:MAG: hypothetical protein Q8Q05_00590 [bacterium]|nr:hypothetical protein [bacterium]
MTKQETFSSQRILVFDTTGRDQTSVALVVEGKVKKLVSPVRAQELQELTDKLLRSAKTQIEDIDAVAVLNGPGSYTGTRMGVAAANTLGWLLDKPIIELEGDSLDSALDQLQNNRPKPVVQATARY